MHALFLPSSFHLKYAQQPGKFPELPFLLRRIKKQPDLMPIFREGRENWRQAELLCFYTFELKTKLARAGGV
jgi:hypothetical protein